MKKIKFLIMLLFINSIFTANLYCQYAIVPGAPCYPNVITSSVAPTNVTLKLLFVEFQDVQHRTIPSAYTATNFNNLFFSTNTYVSPNMYSPDGETVFGSVKDYYRVVSNNQMTITGQILNHVTNNTLEWITLPHTKSWYASHADSFRIKSLSMADSFGFDISTSRTNPAHTYIIIIYAGQCYRGSPYGLNPSPSTNLFNGVWYYSISMSERFSPDAPDYQVEKTNATFSHIGIPAHEIGHFIGMSDHYSDTGIGEQGDTGWWDLMGSGNYCGPLSKVNALHHLIHLTEQIEVG